MVKVIIAGKPQLFVPNCILRGTIHCWSCMGCKALVHQSLWSLHLCYKYQVSDFDSTEFVFFKLLVSFLLGSMMDLNEGYDYHAGGIDFKQNVFGI